MSPPVSELLALATAAAVAGVATGVLAGLFGIGGGAVMIPVLYEAFRILGVPEEGRMQLCLGTSLAIMVPTTQRCVPTGRIAPGSPVLRACCAYGFRPP